MPFGLTNAPATFQAHINRILSDLVDRICVVYLDDILIFSNSRQEHIEHVKLVLNRLRQAKLYAKLSKCAFFTTQTEYLGFIVTTDGLTIDPKRVQAIQEWPAPSSVRDIRIFVGFINYYRRFIRNFSQIAAPLNQLTKKEPNSAKGGHRQRKEESALLDIGDEGRKAFKELKGAFLTVPILIHYNSDLPCRVETDASGIAVCGILSQQAPNEDGKAHWRPIAFFSRKLSSAERNYHTHDQELLAVVESFREWRHYLQGSKHPFELFTDHDNLRWFLKTKKLNGRQVRWASFLAGYHFEVIHRPGHRNPADGPSRRPDYGQEEPDDANSAIIRRLGAQLTRMGEVEGSSRQTAAVHELPSISVVRYAPRTSTGPQVTHYEAIAAVTRSQAHEEELEILSDVEEPEEAHNSTPDPEPNEPVLVEDLAKRALLLRKAHDDPWAGHFGADRMVEHIRRQYTWPKMRNDCEQHVKQCIRCQRGKPRRHKPYGTLMPLPVPDGPWQWVTMDFITDLPKSKFLGMEYDSILVVVDRFTKMAHFVPSRKDVRADELAQVFIHEVIRHHGVPDAITSDRGSTFNSNYWRTFCSYLNTKLRMSTAHHPQTDGQTERMNQVIIEYLRIFCNFEQDDWTTWLDSAEFAYNDSRSSTTEQTPFMANLGRHPRGPQWSSEGKLGPSPPAKEYVREMTEQVRKIRTKLQDVAKRVQETSKGRYKEMTFQKGDKVLLNNKYLATLRKKRKLDWLRRGPYTISEVINNNAYQLDLPEGSRVHPVFNISLLEPFVPASTNIGQEALENDTLPVDPEDADEKYDVKRIDEAMVNEDGIWMYKVIWKNYPEEDYTWEPAPNLDANTMRAWNIRKKRLEKEADQAKRGQTRPNEPKSTETKPKRGRGRPPKKKKIVK